MEINNEVYDKKGHLWWDDDEEGNFTSLRFMINPVRFDYFKAILNDRYPSHNHDITILDVGCGGGFLSEEFAKFGLRVTGIDPSKESIATARRHAEQEHLNIEYHVGFGESLPFEANTFDIVCGCDMLEHVNDVNQVIGEISRVLKPQGMFFYETINRTMVSKLLHIKVLQEWSLTAFCDPHVHVWNMFIKPKELKGFMAAHNLFNQETKGLAPASAPNFVMDFLKLRKGQISWRKLGKRANFRVTNNTLGSYIGYAVKRH